MKIVKKVSLKELQEMAEKMYGDMVKADVDLAKKIVIVDMEMHADGEAELLKTGSKQEDLWGINLYPKNYGNKNFIVFESLINTWHKENKGMVIKDPVIRNQIKKIISEAVYE